MKIVAKFFVQNVLMVLGLYMCLANFVSSWAFASSASIEFATAPGTYWSAVYQVSGKWFLELAGDIPVYFPFNGEILGYPVTNTYLKDLRTALSHIPAATDFTVILASGGGSIATMETSSKTIRSKCLIPGPKKICNITTYVPSGHECSSACVRMFMLGDIRIAGGRAKFGFHIASNLLGYLRDSKEQLESLAQLGINRQWLESLLSRGVFSSQNMTFFSGAEMFGSDIIHRFEDFTEFQSINDFHSHQTLHAGSRRKSLEELTLPTTETISKTFLRGRILQVHSQLNLTWISFLSGGDRQDKIINLCYGAEGSSRWLNHTRRSGSQRSTLIEKLRYWQLEGTEVQLTVESSQCIGDVSPAQ